MYFAGFLVSGIINHYLKITFKQERPERSMFIVTFSLKEKIFLFYFSSRSCGFLRNSWNAEWSFSMFFLFYDIFINFSYS